MKLILKIVEGYTVKEPDAPFKEGSELSYWALNGVEYDFDTPVNGDITLVAIWQEKYKQLVNYTMLYDYGDECIEITGGWDKYLTSADSYYSGNKKALTKNSDNISNGASVSFREVYSLLTNNLINTEGYTKLCACVTTTASATYGTATILRFTEDNVKLWGGPATAHNQWQYIDPKTKVFLIGNISKHGEYYANIGVIGDKSPSSGYSIFYTVFLLKADDWETLTEKAGLTATSIEDILTNAETLLTNEEAVNYMLKNCTGDFMVSAIQNETFLTALENSPYKTKIYANTHWSKFLTMVA